MNCRILQAVEEDREELSAPLRFFVEISSYTKLHGEAPAETEISFRKRRGETLAGVAQLVYFNCILYTVYCILYILYFVI